ncbi:MAG: ornithine carbamoyltransferase, partial [Candidatus Margulisbacteria bacterium]|nr:ornithine carbamoyltransferase [Candidatus Margulisiibacteriota bacterium]
MGKLSHKDFISIHDLTSSEIEEIFSLAFDLKKKQQNSEKHEYLWAKAMVMIFEKPSTRT